MPLISYSQNFEDVMLWRALSEVKGGFYIDVGAWDPDRDSVTLAFYERGWHGINIEPVTTYFDRLKTRRPRDINLKAALGARSEVLPFFEVLHTGLSTLDPKTAAKHRADGHTVVEGTVEVTTLADICRQYAPSDIHFLKIDAEQAEFAVLSGADFKAFRPWIVVVEATLPNTQIRRYSKWERILLNADYHFVWFDGLNRFYLATEHEKLSKHFRTPVNVFDDFKSGETVRINSENIELSSIAEDLKIENAELLTTAGHLRIQNAELSATAGTLSSENAALAETINNLQLILLDRDRAIEALELTVTDQAHTMESLSQSESKTRDEITGLRQIAQQRETLIETQAAQLDSVLNRLRFDQGPRALKFVLPLARLLRWLHLRLVAQNQKQTTAPSAPVIGPSGPSTARPNLMKIAVARPLYRSMRSVVRPLAVRSRAFLMQEILQELRRPLQASPAPPQRPE
jgi:FkbM family methyltransferase